MRNKKNVLVYGWFGNENLGDELILKSLISQIKKIDNDLVINVMGSKPKNILKYHKGINLVSTYVDNRFKSILRLFKYNGFSVIENIISNDYLVIGCGGALSDWNKESTYNLFCLINLFKDKLKKPVIMLGVGAGPIIRQGSKKKFKKVLSKVDTITVRDEESFELLKNIGLNNVYLTNDLVFDIKDEFKGYNRVLKDNSNKNIGVVIAPLIFNKASKYEKYKASIIKYIEFMKSKNYNITLIPFQYEYDINFLNEIKNDTKVEVFSNGKNNMWSIIDEIRKQDLIIGMRLHSVIVSLILRIPVIPIIYHSKVYSVAKKFNILNFAQNIGDGENWIDEDINPEKLFLDSEFYLQHLESKKKKIEDIFEKEFSMKNIAHLHNILSEDVQYYINMKGILK